MFPLHYYAGQTAVVHQDPSPTPPRSSSLSVSPLRALFPSIPLCTRFSSSRSAVRTQVPPQFVCVCARALDLAGHFLFSHRSLAARCACWCLTLARSLALALLSPSLLPAQAQGSSPQSSLPYPTTDERRLSGLSFTVPTGPLLSVLLAPPTLPKTGPNAPLTGFHH